MACRCKVSESIDAMYKKYGSISSNKRKTNISGIVLRYVREIPMFLLMIPSIPLMFIVNIFKSLTNSKIKIGKHITLR